MIATSKLLISASFQMLNTTERNFAFQNEGSIRRAYLVSAEWKSTDDTQLLPNLPHPTNDGNISTQPIHLCLESHCSLTHLASLDTII